MRNKKQSLIFLSIALIAILFLCFSISASSGDNNEIKATLEHPFLVDGSWVPANELKSGDLLTTVDGKKAVVTSIEKVHVPEGFSVYNFETFENNYVVSSGDVIVHNSQRGPIGLGDENYAHFILDPSCSPHTINQVENVYAYTKLFENSDSVFMGVSWRAFGEGGKLNYAVFRERYTDLLGRKIVKVYVSRNPYVSVDYALLRARDYRQGGIVARTTLSELRKVPAVKKIEIPNKFEIVIHVFEDKPLEGIFSFYKPIPK